MLVLGGNVLSNGTIAHCGARGGRACGQTPSHPSTSLCWRRPPRRCLVHGGPLLINGAGVCLLIRNSRKIKSIKCSERPNCDFVTVDGKVCLDAVVIHVENTVLILYIAEAKQLLLAMHKINNKLKLILTSQKEHSSNAKLFKVIHTKYAT